jgi:glucosamine--fructose-6-phosphate aminotransferase (isomerizing)
LDGLARLEYRGYDSAGVAVVEDHRVVVVKAAGRLARLQDCLSARPVAGTVGIAHTRWATHGRPSERNAHPHWDCSRSVALVHNGILDNHGALRAALQRLGHRFSSETDTEVLAHLIEMFQGERLPVAVVSDRAPHQLVVARHGSPLVIGLGQGETFAASDATALLAYTRDHVVLEDGELAVIDADGVRVSRVSDGADVVKRVSRASWDPVSAERGTYPNFMRKEIDEQPRVLDATLRDLVDPATGRVALASHGLDPAAVRALKRLVLVGCGSSHHAALVGKGMIERLGGGRRGVGIPSSRVLDRGGGRGGGDQSVGRDGRYLGRGARGPGQGRHHPGGLKRDGQQPGAPGRRRARDRGRS